MFRAASISTRTSVPNINSANVIFKMDFILLPLQK